MRGSREPSCSTHGSPEHGHHRDGGIHAFLLDTMVSARAGRQGIGTRLVEVAVGEARSTDCEWLHVDFDDELRAFYFEACGFTPTNAGLIKLA
jgi:GNAT superfamily N-acetyltransferase